MEELQIIRMSVRSLVEFLLRCGDLDNRRGGTHDKEAMQKGSSLHRKIQRKMGPNYKSEVALVYEKQYEEFVIRLEGRADGIFSDEAKMVIDEIKGTYMDLQHLKGPIEVHRAQAMCYAYIYAEQQDLDEIWVQMTYCNIETEDIKRFREEFTKKKLEMWFENLLDQYYKWAYYQYERRRLRRESMAGLEFPFPYREGQRDLVTGVYRTIIRKKQIFIQAPTGVGKTMSTIFPAVRAVGEGHGDKIFYLTAKTVTRTVAEEAFSILKGKGLSYKTITLTAKEKMCICDQVDCNPQNCPYAKGHFDKVNDAVYELITTEDTFDRDTLAKHADKWQVCPYEMCLDVAVWVDAVICDYNYVFDPNVFLRRFFGEGVRGEYLFLIDEAHNLVDRGRQMYSASIYKEDVLEVKRAVKPVSRNLVQSLERCNRQLLEYKRECETYEILPNVGALSISLTNLAGQIELFLEEEHEKELQRLVLDFSFQVRHFLNMCDLLDENYVIYTEHDEDGRFHVTLFCVNPAVNLQGCLNKGRSTVFFSATLLPIQYYRKLFSTNGDDYAIYAKSPFEREKLCLMVGQDVSSKYTRRGYEEYRKIAEYIHRTILRREGNYMVFFPSYRLLQDIYEIYQELYQTEEVRCILQSTSMREEEREEFLSNFEAEHEGILAGFCVMGGIFSEGIDLIGDKLIGAIIVGTGLPQVSHEREIVKNFYDQKGENGFDYAYRFPGMNKVLQSAGRVIRTKEDRGVVLLLDERFRNYEYRLLFPKEWENFQTCALGTLEEHIMEFWSKNMIAQEIRPENNS